MRTDVTDLIERMPPFEARAGIRLEALFGELLTESKEHRVEVRGEAFSTSGEKLAANIELVLTVYDEKGRVVATTSTWLSDDTFFVFDTFELSCFDIATKPARLRIHPKFS